MSDYQPVPVAAAKAIAEQFDKSMVIVLAWDERHQRTHVTTYGRTATDKQNAAEAGNTCAWVIGGGADLVAKQTFEDFRDNYDAAALARAAIRRCFKM